jgi:hypothetical protein
MRWVVEPRRSSPGLPLRRLVGAASLAAAGNWGLSLSMAIRPPTENLETGGVVGIAEVSNCVAKHDSDWFDGPFGFVLRKRRPLPFIEWKGAPGLREAP